MVSEIMVNGEEYYLPKIVKAEPKIPNKSTLGEALLDGFICFTAIVKNISVLKLIWPVRSIRKSRLFRQLNFNISPRLLNMENFLP